MSCAIPVCLSLPPPSPTSVCWVFVWMWVTKRDQRKMEEAGCEIICGAPTTLAVKGLMMMMIERLRVRIPAAAAGEFSSPESTLCANTYSVSVPPPCYRSGT